jgi:6-phospho-beta-glucosidase
VKLTVLGGGGMRVPALVRGVLSEPTPLFDLISLFETDEERRETICRLAASLPGGRVEVATDLEAACAGADFVFSAIRVGGDRGRVIDEEVALRHGLVGQETTGAGGCAMALRTVPVVLSYCKTIERCAPGAALVNLTNPAGLITQAILAHTSISAVGVCDTPSAVIEKLAHFLHLGDFQTTYYGLNHLGWVTSLRSGGRERIGEVLAAYEQLSRTDRVFSAIDPAIVRRLGAVPTEYLSYYYDPSAYVSALRRRGSTRGEDVRAMNAALISQVAKALGRGALEEAWSEYDEYIVRRAATYMEPESGRPAPAGQSEKLGGYERAALAVVRAMSSRDGARLVVNVRNGASLPFLAPEDVVEVPAHVGAGQAIPVAQGGPPLPTSAVGLVCQVKEYERAVVEAAASGDAGLAAIGLSMHPLVPGLSMARSLISEYRDRHGPHLAYLK